MRTSAAHVTLFPAGSILRLLGFESAGVRLDDPLADLKGMRIKSVVPFLESWGAELVILIPVIPKTCGVNFDRAMKLVGELAMGNIRLWQAQSWAFMHGPIGA